MSESIVKDKTDAEVQSGQQNAQQAEFNIQKIFIKNVSFERLQNAIVPVTKEIKFTMNVDTRAEQLNAPDKTYEVSLNLTITATVEEQNVFFTKLSQSGIFTLKHFPAEQLGYFLNAYCPNLLFPYASRAIADLVLHAGFAPIHLAPINFDAMFQQRAQQKQPGKN